VTHDSVRRRLCPPPLIAAYDTRDPCQDGCSMAKQAVFYTPTMRLCNEAPLPGACNERSIHLHGVPHSSDDPWSEDADKGARPRHPVGGRISKSSWPLAALHPRRRDLCARAHYRRELEEKSSLGNRPSGRPQGIGGILRNPGQMTRTRTPPLPPPPFPLRSCRSNKVLVRGGRETAVRSVCHPHRCLSLLRAPPVSPGANTCQDSSHQFRRSGSGDLVPPSTPPRPPLHHCPLDQACVPF